MHPSIVLSPDDILTADKLNLLGTPVVELAVSDASISDQNYLRNGNLYSSFWTTPAGVNCPVGIRTTNASYWNVKPTGGTSIATTATTNSTVHLTAISSTTGMLAGMQVVGQGIPAGATIVTVVSSTAIDLNVAATTSATGVAITVGSMVVFSRSNTVPDTDSLFSAEVQGNAGVSNVRFSQDITGDLAATLRHQCTFSGYVFNNTGVNLTPQLVLATPSAFNNFSTLSDVSTTSLQSCPNATWTYVTDTVDLTSLSNVANGLSVIVSFGGANATTAYVLFSRLKFQLGEIATPFTDDVSLFVQSPSVDAAALQDGCIARPTLFLPKVIPPGTYENKSILDGDIADNTITSRALASGTIVTTGTTNSTINITGIPDTTGMAAGMPISGAGIPSGDTIASVISGTAITLATAATASASGVTLTVTKGGGAVIGSLGYTPVNKAGDTNVGALDITVDTVVGAGSPAASGLIIDGLAANSTNDGYFPAIAFRRGTGQSRAVGLESTGKLKTVDGAGVVGYLLDSVHQVDTNSIQDKAVTLAKLSDALVALLIAPGTIHQFGGSTPPTGWLICDGSPVNRTTYAALFTAIGTIWGGGDGTTTFNLPDFRGRAPIGYVNVGIGGITARAFGSLGGEENHGLSQAEMPSHTHAVSPTSHNHTYVNPLGGSIPGIMGGGGQTLYSPAGVTVTSDAASVTLAATGGSGSHNNMQPFAVLYFIIKT